MIDKLPYTLTGGVTATSDGLTGDVERIGRLLDLTPEREADPPVIGWPDAAERLRYREGEPWCREHQHKDNSVVNEPSTEYASLFDGGAVLHRLAAILCDDAEAFRVLHWCVAEFGGSE